MPTDRMPRNLALCAFLLAALAPTATAQVLGRVEGRQASGGSYYVNALPNEPTIRVAVIGDVPNAGIYDLGDGFDELQALVSLAGGPTAAELDPRDPSVVVRLVRRGAPVLSEDYSDLMSQAAVPLSDGDQVEVETVFSRGLYVWGAVRTPGYYEVGPEVTAVRLLALAGGPQADGARAEAVAQDGTVAIFRPGAGVIYESSVEAFVTGEGVPTMRDGDALQVEVILRNRFTFRDGLTLVGSVAAVVLAVFQISDALSN